MRNSRILMSLFLVLMAAFTLTACGGADEAAEKQQQEEAAQTAELQERVRDRVPFPEVSDSLELRNLKERYELLDDPNKIGWVYLIDHGLIFAEYQVKGKVSSLNSQFTNPLQNIDNCDANCSGYTVAQAEPDGSYGDNPNGIFFWTTDGVYVEWAGNYQYSDERLEIQQPAQNVLTQPVG